MPTLLVTGFDPFGGQSINPAWEAVRLLPDTVGCWQLVRLQIPTVFGEAALRTLEAQAACGADAVLCIGQAAGRAAVTPELIGINLRYAASADNAGNLPQDEPVIPDGPAAYFSTLPVRSMAQAIRDAGFPAAVSSTAGTYVCNDLLYTLLHRLPGLPVGFIHVPLLPCQAAGNQPSMALEDIVSALTAAIGSLDIPPAKI